LANGQLYKANGSVVSQVQLPDADFSFDYPSALWADLSGTVYVGEQYIADGFYTTAGNLEGRVVRFNAFGAPLAFVSTNTPYGVATDSQGNIYYITQGGTEVYQLSPTGEQLSTLTDPNNPISDAQAVAVDRSGNVFVLDLNNGNGARVLQLSSSGSVTATYYTPYPYLGQVSHMALDACGNVYVADPDNGRIVEFILYPGCSNAAQATAVPAVCTAPPPYVYYPLPNPTGVAVDRYGNVFGLDGSNGGIVQYPVTGGATTAAYPLTAFPDLVNGLTIDGCGQQYVTDVRNLVLWKVNSSAVVEFGLFNGTSFLSSPGPSWVDSEGIVYLVNSGRESILKFNQGGKVVASFPQPYNYGLLVALATDSAGDIFVAFESPTVAELTATGAFKAHLQTFTQSGYGSGFYYLDQQAGGLTIDRNNYVYVSDQANDCVVQYNTQGEPVATFFTPPPFLGDPTHVAVDLCGNVYVVDESNNRIVQFVTNSSCVVAAQPFIAPSYCPKPAAVHSSSLSSTGAARHVSSSSSTKGK
jgi:sugar lactone lactonase YvrE